jgi:hypothetical protein
VPLATMAGATHEQLTYSCSYGMPSESDQRSRRVSIVLGSVASQILCSGTFAQCFASRLGMTSDIEAAGFRLTTSQNHNSAKWKPENGHSLGEKLSWTVGLSAENSRLHSVTPFPANKKRKLAQSPVSNTHNLSLPQRNDSEVTKNYFSFGSVPLLRLLRARAGRHGCPCQKVRCH